MVSTLEIVTLSGSQVCSMLTENIKKLPCKETESNK